MDCIENLLLGLYRAARELPIPEFKEEALSELRCALHCDSAMWGVGDMHLVTEHAIRGVHLKNQSHETFVSCEEIKDHDPAACEASRLPSEARTISGQVIGARPADVTVAGVNSAMYEMQNLLVMSLRNKLMPSLGFISLCRVRERDRYSEEERLLAEALHPHFFEAGMINRLLWFDRLSGLRDEDHVNNGSTTSLLTRAERAVAEEIARGLSYKEAARVLGIAPSTVRNQLHAAYAKLGVSSKVALSRCLGDTST